MFFKPVEWKKGSPVHVAKSAALCGLEGYPAEVIGGLLDKYGQADGIQKICAVQAADAPEESYRIEITGECIAITYCTTRGLIYGCVTVLQMLEHGELCTGMLYDEPDCAFRGYRIFLPGRKSFDSFFALADFLAYYKYNYLSLEIGGAMEYKRHPEINRAWQAFTVETHRYSGRTIEIQHGYDWPKNSIHTDNAEGDILTQDEVRMLVKYCRDRGLIVYPETPLLSHCDYLCLAHPEFAERPEDPYPDTYCPSNPKVYDLVFDILDEVIDVFQPEIINIGHDEFYSMCQCPECSKKRPEQVFAEDIIKIHDYLSQRGIRTMMWGEKLLPVVLRDRTHGGAEAHYVTGNGKHHDVPAVYLSQQLLPRDILMSHWYYCFGMQYDFVYHTQGYEAVYGNMSASGVEHWRLRRQFGMKGGSCSNWGSNHPEYMQRNAQYRSLIFGAYALWSREYDSPMQREVLEETFKEAFRYHYGDLSARDYLLVTHTTTHHMKHKYFYDGIFITDEYLLGHYLLTYTDGTQAQLEVKYGSNVANDQLKMPDIMEPRMNGEGLVETADIEELCYSALPSEKDGRTWYTTAYENPCPGKTVASVEYVPVREATVDLLSLEHTCKN